MSSKSELDPLLPRNDPAPEIQGDGYSSLRGYTDDKPSEAQSLAQKDGSIDIEEDEDDTQLSPLTSARSALSTISAIFTIVVFVGFVIAFLGPSFQNDNPIPLPHNPPSTISDRVFSILDGTPLIDGHNDLAIFIRDAYKNKIHSKEFKDKFENGGLELNVDLPRLRRGQAGGALWSAFVACPDDASDNFSDETYSTAVAHTLSQIDLVRRLQSHYSNNFTSATAPLSEALSKFHASRSLISPISIEGLHQIPQSAPLSTLRLYHTLGVRAATLTWNCHNAFADAALISSRGETTVAPYHRGGLTPAGREVIHEMNRLGILVDISHTSYWTQKAVLSNGTSAAPVIFSHSSAFALCQHPRNVHDDILDLVKETRSLVMINFSPAFISCLLPPNSSVLPEFYEKNNTLHQVARHIIYVGEKIGYDYVGLGSDFDGIGELTPRGLEGVDKFPDLIAELLRLGVSDKDAGKVAGGNFLRVWRTAEGIAKGLQRKTQEGEDEVSGW
ncbi:membrane dipeptidase [Capronia epimyces CBS 606.96]|uniref:Dipeptidase n=1 Tax=Capronia epimyces CBS 606.96 TaxID=1182542 RepID=W9XPU1_9EURO|nr:membrane dipeptidase [Capronia epimyces CBS 606.96]EXJ78991.1 membrane dipeptidase [Capronia epimyces CBS 606.96]